MVSRSSGSSSLASRLRLLRELAKTDAVAAAVLAARKVSGSGGSSAFILGGCFMSVDSIGFLPLMWAGLGSLGGYAALVSWLESEPVEDSELLIEIAAAVSGGE